LVASGQGTVRSIRTWSADVIDLCMIIDLIMKCLLHTFLT
jgi:hypothetical protein